MLFRGPRLTRRRLFTVFLSLGFLVLLFAEWKYLFVREVVFGRSSSSPPRGESFPMQILGEATDQRRITQLQTPPKPLAKDNHDPVPPKMSKNVSAPRPSWMYWNEADRPAVYRACVPRPTDMSMAVVVTGGRVEKSNTMTVIRCVNNCISLGLTYAALSRGTECFCSDVKGDSALLNYMDSALCDVPCPGDSKYSCGGQEYMSLYRTSLPDSRCSKMELKPVGSLPLIALASFPRSGNTWTRQLIQWGSGLLTGSVYWIHERNHKTAKLYPGGNINYRTNQTICVKTHIFNTEHIRLFEGALLLIRNPFKALVAEVFRLQRVGKLESAVTAMEFFKSSKWEPFVRVQMKKWRDIAIQWITQSPRVHVTHYEDLEDNPYDELIKMVRFLNVTVDPARILCATQEQPSSKLTGIYLGASSMEQRKYLTHDPFSAKLRQSIDDITKKVNQTLVSHHLKPLPQNYSVKVF